MDKSKKYLQKKYNAVIYILNFEGEIPGARKEECGNYSEQNLDMAKYYVKKYLDELNEYKRFVCPE